MAVMACPDCFREVSDAAPACLGCGRPRNPAPAPTDQEFYDAISHQIEREDGLVNQRITWLMQFEGLLFAGIGLFHLNATPSGGKYETLAMKAFPAAGIAAAVVAGFGIQGARDAANELKNSYVVRFGSQKEKWVPPFWGPVTRDDEHRLRRTLKFLGAQLGDYSRALPWIIGLTWAYLFLMSRG
jgi:hypothetical protein